MNRIPPIFHKFWPQLLHFVVPPVFFVAFVLLYRPDSICSFMDMGRGLLSFNVTISACIIFGVIFSFRLIFFLLRRAMNMEWDLYVVWCIAEMFVSASFLSLYFVLRYKGSIAYFDVLGRCLALVFSILVYPYMGITMGLALNKSGERAREREDDLIRFQDDHKRVKLVIASSAVLYIMARENYVQIYYLDAERIKDYILRTSMKGIEDLITSKGLVRCHRSYFVNPKHIEVLRRDREGQMVVLLDVPASAAPLSSGINVSSGAVSIPVSKRYIDEITSILA